MKRYATAQLRNVALAGHSGAGKTTLSEALLHVNKLIERPGTVEAGNTQSDYDPEEAKRRISLNASLLPLELPEHKINILDCPGFRDFVGEIKNAIRVSELALLVLDAATGSEVGTEFAWEFAHEYNIPCAIFVNKMDGPRADFLHAMQTIEQSFETRCIPVTLPIGSGESFKGVIDLLDMKAVYDAGGTAKIEPIPAALQEEANAARKKLIEAAAEGDDHLTEKFLMEETLTDEEIIAGLRQDLQAGSFIPVLCGSGIKEIGLTVLQNFLVKECPSPDMRKGVRGFKTGASGEIELKRIDPAAPFSAVIFKTVNDDYAGRLSLFKVVTGEFAGDTQVRNMRTDKIERVAHVFELRGKSNVSVPSVCAGDIGALAKLDGAHTGDTLNDPKGPPVAYEPTHMPAQSVHMAVAARNKSEEDRLGIALHRLVDQDPTLAVERDSMLHQTIMKGMGDTHLEVCAARLATISRVALDLHPPKIQYRETITRKGDGQGKFKRQTGGRGQYGDCWVRLAPLVRGSGVVFEWKVVGGVIPTNYTGSVEKGVREACSKGMIAGYPMVDVKIECYDGSYHAVDSSDMAFQIAGSLAFKNVAEKCGVIFLEPICKVMVDVPEHNMGDVLGYLSGKRGRITGNENIGRRVRIEAEVPQAEMATFSRDLRSMTSGRSIYEASFGHYEPVPAAIMDKVAKENKIEHHPGEM